MEKFKVEIWRKDKIEIIYQPLNQVEMQEVIDNISKKLDIRLCCDSLLFTKLSEVLIDQIILLNINEPDGFECLVSKLNLNIPRDIVVDVIWNYDSIDCFEFDVLKKSWEYIWYGTSDEMCLLYFPDINFVIMLTDYGTMYYKWL